MTHHSAEMFCLDYVYIPRIPGETIEKLRENQAGVSPDTRDKPCVQRGSVKNTNFHGINPLTTEVIKAIVSKMEGAGKEYQISAFCARQLHPGEGSCMLGL
jgi:hypothetical protein